MSDIEDEILKTMAYEIQKEIDGEIMLDFLVEQGWMKVMIPEHNNLDVTYWCQKNLMHDWMNLSQNCYVFRNKKDAEWFILRWT